MREDSLVCSLHVAPASFILSVLLFSPDLINDHLFIFLNVKKKKEKKRINGNIYLLIWVEISNDSCSVGVFEK